MRLAEKIVTIIFVASEAHELKKSEGENITLVHLPNQRGVLISTGERNGPAYPSSSQPIRSLPKSNREMGNNKTQPKNGDYGVQGQFTKMYFRMILMCKQGCGYALTLFVEIVHLFCEKAGSA